MKLLVVNWQDRLNPQAGGAEIHVHETFGRLAARGHRVTLLASGWKGAPQRERLDGMEVHRVGGRHTFNARAPGYHRRELAGERFDVVVEALNKVPVFTPLWAGRPCVLLVHHLFGATAFREASVPVAAATWLLERPIGRVYRGRPAQAISRSTADDLVERGLHPSDLRVIYPGVELGFYTPDPAVPREAEPTFLYLGRLRRYKGVHLVIRAVAALRDRGTRVRLRVGGKGEYEPELRRLAAELRVEDRVEFLGFVSEERKRELFRTAWANVFPSPKEGWGITNVEAAACGTPTVASDSPGLRESVLHERTGLLYPHGDIDAMADAMGRLAADPSLVARYGAEARRFAEGFTWDR
ncbi:MAG TPA: glycosyltransferase family 4 protein, partial [Longimicrobiaceae bacterium]